MNNQTEKPLLHEFTTKTSKPLDKFYLLVLAILGLGIVSGYGLALTRSNQKTGGVGTSLLGESKKTAGVDDAKTFRDTAEGELQFGGINGEGTHKLIRPGGENQTVYLTSSVLDLNEFTGKRTRVWGETFAAQKAGWLMDVGKIEVLQ